MRSSLPKVLHRVGGRTLLEAVLASVEGLAPERVLVVVGAERSRIEAALGGRRLELVLQDPPLGTGDAVRKALPALGKSGGPVLILAGDTPLLTEATLARLVALRAAKDLDLAFLSFRPPEPGEFGRVVRDARGRVRRIVEATTRSAPGKDDRRGQRRRLLLRCRSARARALTHRQEPARRGVLPDRRRRGPGRLPGKSRSHRSRGLARGLGRQYAPGPRGGRGDGAPPRRRAGSRRRSDGARSGDGPHRPRRPFRARRDPAPVRVSRGRDRPRRGLRGLLLHAARRHAVVRVRLHRSALRERELHDRSPGSRRAVLAPAPEVGDRRGRPDRQLRRDQEHARGEGSEGAAPLVSRRRGRRRRSQHRRGRHHVQLRRREETPDDDRRRRIRRKRRAARGAGDRRRGSVRGRRHDGDRGRARRSPGDLAARRRSTSPAGPPGRKAKKAK